MLRKVLASLAAAAVFATTFSPVDAAAQRYGYHDRDRRDYDRGRRHHYRDRHRDNGDAVAAGVVGLILGVTIASLASQQRDQRSQQSYYGGRDQGYDPRYDDRSGSAYESDYGDSGGYYEDDRPCLRREERWDNASGGYITVVTPC